MPKTMCEHDMGISNSQIGKERMRLVNDGEPSELEKIILVRAGLELLTDSDSICLQIGSFR